MTGISEDLRGAAGSIVTIAEVAVVEVDIGDSARVVDTKGVAREVDTKGVRDLEGIRVARVLEGTKVVKDLLGDIKAEAERTITSTVKIEGRTMSIAGTKAAEVVATGVEARQDEAMVLLATMMTGGKLGAIIPR